MITGKNYIGKTLSAKGDVVFRTMNPQLNIENPNFFAEATREEVEEAVELAWQAFKTYSKVPGPQRAKFLSTIADNIMALGQELLDMFMLESGLPEGRAQGERARTVSQLRSFADLVSNEDWRGNTFDAADLDREPFPKFDHRKTVIPLGPIAVFGASNFPLAYSTAGGDTASALAAGCPVILKSHPMHAGTSELVTSAIIKAVEETAMPNGVFSSINGGIEAGTFLVKHPKVKGVGFTGSFAGGRSLFNMASQREEPIPVFAEMGSINPVVITPTAITNRASEIASSYASSITLGAGQFCTNPGLLLTIDGENTQSFLKELAEKIVATEPQCMLHPNIKKGFEKNKANVMAQKGVEIVGGTGTVIKENYAVAQVATISGSDFLENPKAHQEVFGPFTLVVRCTDEGELIKVIEGLEGQLTGTLIAEEEDVLDLEAVVDALVNRVGRVIYNGVPTGVEVCPSMQHGGPYPASTDSRFTAVGVHAIKRWVRPICYQSFPEALLPDSLKK